MAMGESVWGGRQNPMRPAPGTRTLPNDPLRTSGGWNKPMSGETGTFTGAPAAAPAASGPWNPPPGISAPNTPPPAPSAGAPTTAHQPRAPGATLSAPPLPDFRYSFEDPRASLNPMLDRSFREATKVLSSRGGQSAAAAHAAGLENASAAGLTGGAALGYADTASAAPRADVTDQVGGLASGFLNTQAGFGENERGRAFDRAMQELRGGQAIQQLVTPYSDLGGGNSIFGLEAGQREREAALAGLRDLWNIRAQQYGKNQYGENFLNNVFQGV